ncbi:MAG: hypothetical protein K2J97_02815, partial [Muribaculaceae bacterium]|nr:hypothetical protein [Muribaculaceae bacterium]
MMKKSLLLAALFTALFIGFTACSDNDEVYESVGYPPHWIKVDGELFKANGAYFFRATDNEDELLLKELRDSVFPVSMWAVQDNSIDIEKYIGYVRMEISESFNDSIWVKSIVSTKNNNRSRFITPEFDTPPPAWFFEPKSRSSFQKDGRYEMINVFVHVVLDSSGNISWAMDKDIIASEVIRVLNQDHGMNDTHIFFKLIGSDYINYITSSFNLDNDYEKIFIQKYEYGALNIYIPYKQFSAKFDGIAGNIISSCCLIQYNFYNTSVVTHETGHCFGLYHTHHGTDPKEPYDADKKTRAIPELVNGSNADKAGDYIIDTRADPNCWTDAGTYDTSKGLKDANGESYNPDPENFMSYSGASKIKKFSDQQIEKMHEAIENSSIVTEMAARRISPTESDMGGVGKLHFSERTKTLTFPVVADDEVVTWTISQRSSSGNATSQASPKVTTATGKSITVTHNSLSDYFEVYATTMTLYGKERKSKVWKATAGVPSAAVGTLSWTSGDGTSGSFPGYSPTLTLSNYDTSLDLKYTDLANPTYRSGITYRLYTS